MGKRTTAVDEEEEEPDVDAAETRRLRKAAKRAAAAAAEEEEEVDPEEAKRLRKAAKRAAKAEDVPAPKEQKEQKGDVPAPKEQTEPRASASRADAAGDWTCFVRGIPYSIDQAQMRSDFSECGEILKLNLPLNEEGKARGYAFITFKTKAGMEECLKWDSQDYNGRWLEIKQAETRGAAGGGKGEKGGGRGAGGKGEKAGGRSGMNSDYCVFVGSLPVSVDEEQLRHHFAECGELRSARIPTHGDGTPKGMAFLRFTSDEAVEKAIALSESELGGNCITARKAVDHPTRAPAAEGKEGNKGAGKDAKGKGKGGKGTKGKARSSQAAARDGAMVESTGTMKTFDDSDDE